ncbi:MAG: NUDIX domain-containing protein [Gammaproteobacteria bacterium]|nr:NUDIX domain-containing protein [Gammaproteobacteria bacterium]
MTEPKLSCGVVVARQTAQGWATLMLRAFHHWDFPKGIRERGEEPMQAALREVSEETGIVDLVFDWGERYFETGPYSRGKVARYYIAETRQEDVEMGVSPTTGEPEHHEWRWVTFDEAHDLGSPRVRQIVRWARQIIGA